MTVLRSARVVHVHFGVGMFVYCSYSQEARESFLKAVELEKAEAARRKLSQVLETETPPASVTNLSITGLENHSWPIPDLANVYGTCQSLLRLGKEVQRMETVRFFGSTLGSKLVPQVASATTQPLLILSVILLVWLHGLVCC